MIVRMEYEGRSTIINSMRHGRVFLAADRLREPTFFQGRIKNPVLFREALAALYQVVISDFKYRPKDREAFRAWLEEQDRLFLANLAAKNKKVRARLQELEGRLAELNRMRQARLRRFAQAKERYFDHRYAAEFEQQLVYDPVITVHPDEVAFEAFSRDESTYARLAFHFELFEDVQEFQCGTTNIDFGTGLHQELLRLRSYRQTSFQIAPAGVQLTSGVFPTHEKKIDLPESWIMGFLQVHSTMTLGLTRFHMAPIDLFNICRQLRRVKTRSSPRALRYELVPGQPVRAILEPWEHAFELTPTCPMDGGRPLTLQLTPGAIYDGNKPLSIRTWGRDRLRTIIRLLPWTRRIDVFLAGHGMPSFYVLDLGPATFTLALSGWTDNDWTGGGKFDLLTRPLSIDAAELTRVHDVLRYEHSATDGALANETGLSINKTRSALSHLCQLGRAMYDLASSVYRRRELFAEPLTIAQALKAVQALKQQGSTEEKAAEEIFARGNVFITSRRPVATGYKLTGSVKGSNHQRVRPLLHVDHESKVIEAECTCGYY